MIGVITLLNSISKLVRNRRRELGLTMNQLASKANVSESFISRLERGEINNMRVKKLNDVAKALGWSLGDFFINSKINDAATIELFKYISSLSDQERQTLSESILKIIKF